MSSADSAIVHGQPSSALEHAVHSSDPETIKAAVADLRLTENLALSLLNRLDLPAEILEQLSKKTVSSGRKVKLALIAHNRTPRHISIALLRQLFTFDLMQVSLTPVIPADLKIAAEQMLLDRLGTLPSGSRFSLARRSSGRIAAALLLDPEDRIRREALNNARMTEALVIKAITGPKATTALVRAVCGHPLWSARRDLRVALICNAKTPPSRSLEFARGFPVAYVRELLRASHLPAGIQARILESLAEG
jgi:hypothetical protein